MKAGLRPSCLLSLVLGTASSGLYGADVEGLRVWSGPASTRIVLDLSTATAYRVFALDAPNRIVIDLTDAQISLPIDIPAPRGFVAGVRTGARPGGDLRLVLDLTQAVKPDSFLLDPNDTYGHRLVVDLTKLEAAVVIRRVPQA